MLATLYPTIVRAAERWHIPARLTREDICEMGAKTLAVLARIRPLASTPGFHLMWRRRFLHEVVDSVRFHLRSVRDCRRTVSGDAPVVVKMEDRHREPTFFQTLPVGSDPASRLEARELWAKVRSCLPPSDAAVLDELAGGKTCYVDIAVATGISHRTVKRSVQRIRAVVRAILGNE